MAITLKRRRRRRGRHHTPATYLVSVLFGVVELLQHRCSSPRHLSGVSGADDAGPSSTELFAATANRQTDETISVATTAGIQFDTNSAGRGRERDCAALFNLPRGPPWRLPWRTPQSSAVQCRRTCKYCACATAATTTTTTVTIIILWIYIRRHVNMWD